MDGVEKRWVDTHLSRRGGDSCFYKTGLLFSSRLCFLTSREAWLQTRVMGNPGPAVLRAPHNGTRRNSRSITRCDAGVGGGIVPQQHAVRKRGGGLGSCGKLESMVGLLFVASRRRLLFLEKWSEALYSQDFLKAFWSQTRQI